MVRRRARVILDSIPTLGYNSRFLTTGHSSIYPEGGVAQLGERVNGIHEVRGSIPLASIGQERYGSAGIAQLVEHNLAKVGVAGSSPVSRSLKEGIKAVWRYGQLRVRQMSSLAPQTIRAVSSVG